MSSTAFRSEHPIQAYRIGSREHPLLDGGGAARSENARWNSRGRYIIYATEHYATALLEKAAQLNSVRIPRTLSFIHIDVAAGVTVEEIGADDLAGWDGENKEASRRFGDGWYDARRSLVLLVPSLAAPGLERNVLINQRHHEFGKVTAASPQAVRCHPKLLV